MRNVSRGTLLVLFCSAVAFAQLGGKGSAGSLQGKPLCTATRTTNCVANVAANGAVSGAVAATTTVNGHALSANVAVGANDITTGVLTPLGSVCYLTANIGATSSATPANVCAGWAIAAGKSYALRCQLNVTFVSSATLGITLAGPGSPASWAMRVTGLTGSSAAWQALNTTGTTSYAYLTTGAPGAVTETIIVDAGVTNGATASGTNLTLQTRGNGSNNINVLANSYCQLTQMN